jgi:hypothetical protein
VSGSGKNNLSGDRGDRIGGKEREFRRRAALVGGPFISIPFSPLHVRHNPLKAGSATGWVNSSTRSEPAAGQARKTRLEGRAIASISWSLNEDG